VNNYLRGILALILCIAIPSALFAGETGYGVIYDGGSLPGVKSGTKVKMYIESDKVRFVDEGKELVVVPASAITEISYGQDVHRRVGAAIGVAVVSLGIGALLALSKSKKHFVGLTWAAGDQKGGFAMQCDKNEYRGILAGLEGVSGKKAIDSDAMTVKN
jgi:CxxC motif-containing protein (DUF1111 family)